MSPIYKCNKHKACQIQGSKTCQAVIYLMALLVSSGVLWAQNEAGSPENTEKTVSKASKALALSGLKHDFESRREVILWSELRAKVRAVLP